MELGRIVDVMLAITTVAGVFVFVTSKYSAQIISAFGSSFSSALKAATGR